MGDAGCRESDPDEHASGNQDVGGGLICIRDQKIAAAGAPGPAREHGDRDVDGERPDHHGKQENGDLRLGAGLKTPHGVTHDLDDQHRQQRDDAEAGERLDLAMAIRVRPVGRPERVGDRREAQKRGGRVDQRVKPVGSHRRRVGGRAGRDLGERDRQVRGSDRDESPAGAPKGRSLWIESRHRQV